MVTITLTEIMPSLRNHIERIATSRIFEEVAGIYTSTIADVSNRVQLIAFVTDVIARAGQASEMQKPRRDVSANGAGHLFSYGNYSVAVTPNSPSPNPATISDRKARKESRWESDRKALWQTWVLSKFVRHNSVVCPFGLLARRAFSLFQFSSERQVLCH